MMTRLLICTVAASLATSAMAAPTVASMQGARRVLIVSAPNDGDRSLKTQEQTIDAWRSGAQDRDVTAVEIVGNTVEGAADSAAALRGRYHLPTQGFSVILLGKDGHVAVRSATPIKSASLVQKIDAMPMRRAGQR